MSGKGLVRITHLAWESWDQLGLSFLAPNPSPWYWRLPGRTGLPGGWGSGPSSSIFPSIAGTLHYTSIEGTMPTRSLHSPWSWSSSKKAPGRKRLSLLFISHLCSCAVFCWTSLLPPDSCRSFASSPSPRASCFGLFLRLGGSPLCHVMQTMATYWNRASYCHASCCRHGSPQGCQL